MSSFPHTYKAWLLLLCALFLIARVGGAHWHVCLDGGEPPVAAHIGDAGIHHQGHIADHTDMDLSSTDSGLAKTLKHSLDLPALLAVAFSLWLFAVPYRPA